MNYTPPHRQIYKGPITNTARWQQYTKRPGDVFVCTPPKCGTTWTTTIVTMLCQGSTEITPQELVHWVDAEIVPIDEVRDGLEAQPGRRCLKTHTPLDGIPWFSDTHYIAVYRHPLDMLFSLRKHLANEIDTGDDHPYLADADSALHAFVTRPLDPEDFDFDSLVTFLAHYHGTNRVPQPDNLLMLHYADMLAQPREVVDQISRHIGLENSTSFLDEVAEATSFGNMQSQPERFTPYADKGYWHDPKAFFHSAGTHKWAGKVSAEALAVYQDAIAASLNPAQISWVENGTQGVV